MVLKGFLEVVLVRRRKETIACQAWCHHIYFALVMILWITHHDQAFWMSTMSPSLGKGWCSSKWPSWLAGSHTQASFVYIGLPFLCLPALENEKNVIIWRNIGHFRLGSKQEWKSRIEVNMSQDIRGPMTRQSSWSGECWRKVGKESWQEVTPFCPTEELVFIICRRFCKFLRRDASEWQLGSGVRP